MTFLNPEEKRHARRLAREVVVPGMGELDDAALDEIVARAVWSGLGEPGDRMVAALCDRVGASAALDALAAGNSPTELARFMGESEDNPEWTELVELLADAVERWSPRLQSRDASGHFQRAKNVAAALLVPEHPLWPSGFERLGQHAPVALWLRGRPELLEALDRSVSVVGARASTGYGEHVATDLVSSLVDRGFAIVSGAAYGIDGMAHRAALGSNGVTIAVLAGGIDRLYPSGHDALLKRIIECGLVITELPCGYAPTKWRFLQRNRLIAAASLATVVVEAGWRSGSLNTAHHALDMDIPVGAIPGPVTSASSAGTHRLLRETPAVCVTTANEIVELAIGASEHPVLDETVHPHATRVLDTLSRSRAREREHIAQLSGLSEMQTMVTLGLLEMQGAVRQSETGWVRA